MRKADIFFFVLIFILLIAVFYMVSLMKDKTSQCLRNPFVFGASEMKDVSCECSQDYLSECPARFSFNDTAFINPPTKCPDGILTPKIKINYSALNFTSFE